MKYSQLSSSTANQDTYKKVTSLYFEQTKKRRSWLLQRISWELGGDSECPRLAAPPPVVGTSTPGLSASAKTRSGWSAETKQRKVTTIHRQWLVATFNSDTSACRVQSYCTGRSTGDLWWWWPMGTPSRVKTREQEQHMLAGSGQRKPATTWEF